MMLKKATDLPPAMTLVAVVCGGLLFGVMGTLLASPLLYVGITLVHMLYVEDRLGDMPPPAQVAV